jgi:hypothetical protein
VYGNAGAAETKFLDCALTASFTGLTATTFRLARLLEE